MNYVENSDALSSRILSSQRGDQWNDVERHYRELQPAVESRGELIMHSDHELSSLDIVIRRSAFDDSATADYLVHIPSPAFASMEEGILYRAFSDLLNLDTETEWMHDGFKVKEERVITEHGGSSFVWSIVLDAASFVPEAVLSFGVYKTLEQLVARLGTREQPHLDRDTALQRATWAIVLANESLTRASLSNPIAEEHDASRRIWLFRFRPGDGNEYTATIEPISGLPNVTRVTKSSVPDSG